MENNSRKRGRSNNSKKNNNNNNNTKNKIIKKRAISGNTQVNNSSNINSVPETTVLSSSTSPNSITTTSSSVASTTAPAVITSTTLSTSEPFYKKPLNDEDTQAIFQAEGETIAAGGFGRAERVFYKGRSFVRKISLLDRGSVSDLAREVFQNEVAILRHIRGDPYFPFLYASGIFKNPEEDGTEKEYGLIIMEDLGGLELFELLQREVSSSKNGREVRGISRSELDVLSALVNFSVRRLHQKYSILHLDLKPENIIVRMDNNIILGIVIIDFGFAKFINKSADIPVFGTFSKYNKNNKLLSEGYVSPALVKKRLAYEIIKKPGSPDFYKRLPTNTPYLYKYSIANNDYSLRKTFDIAKDFVYENVDRKNVFALFNKPVLPRFFEDSRKDSLINSILMIMNLFNKTPDQSEVDFNLSAIRFLRRILLNPQNKGYNLANIQDFNGNTLLHKILLDPDFNIEHVERILQLGTNPLITNNKGQTALSIVNSYIQTFQLMMSSSSTDNEDSQEQLEIYQATQNLLEHYGATKGGERTRKTRKQRKRS